MTKNRDLANLLNANGQIDNADIVDNTISNSKFAQPINFKNIIINGDMSIAQRGTSSSGVTSGGYYTVDRFDFDVTTMGTWTQSQSTDIPSVQGFAKSMKFDCTTADASPGAGDRVFVKYKIEGQNLQYLKKGTASAESLTLSFWVKSNKTGTYIAELYDVDNQRQISKSYTINSASTWEKKTITYAGDTSGAFDNDNGNSLQLSLWLGAGSDYTSGTLSTTWTSATATNRAVGQVNLADSTSNEFYITGVQLEAGTSASDFEFLPFDVNLQRCQRYFQIAGGGLWGTISNGAGAFTHRYFNQPLITEMRDVPSISFPSKTISFWIWGGTAGITTTIGRSFDATGLGFIGTQNDKNYVSGRVSTASIDDITRGELLMDVTDDGTFNVDAEL
jgi:hypothetical protein